jgi:tripartite-type tricarboxylate transporter receptor subunit TctC
LAVALGAAALVHGAAAAAAAGDYPTKPVRVIVTVSAGSGGDTAIRTITPKLSAAFGHQFIVDNRVGFSGNIGAETAARATPDGYTLLVVYAGNAISQSVQPNLGYRLDRDFAAVGQFAALPLVLVAHPALGAQSVQELIALARARPKHYLYASPGNGSLPHMAARLFEMRAGIELVHVPYKSTSTAIAELVGGETVATFAAIPTALPHVQSGRLRMLGTSGAKRSPLMASWATIAESGVPGFDVTQWYGLVAPAATPRPIVERLSRELLRTVASAEIQDALTRRGIEPVGATPEAFAAYVRAEIAKWALVARTVGAVVQ